MKAMILAAGRGKRMRHLTDSMPKPLIKLWGRPLIEWQILALKKAGFKDIVINVAYCADKLLECLGDGSKYGVRITFSIEGYTHEESLETRGGIVKALDKLVEQNRSEPFVVVSGDIVTDFPYKSLKSAAKKISEGQAKAHLVLVPNPSYHEGGDMGLEKGKITRQQKQYTYGNIAVFSPSIFKDIPSTKTPLFPWLYDFVDQGLITGEIYEGNWANVGTPEELEKFEKLPPYCYE